MATIRRTLADIHRMKPKVDRAKIDATTEADIRRHMIEDGQHPEGNLSGFAPVIPPQVLRNPLATLRNWEQGRVLPDPAARSLLTIVARNPKAALKALAA
jgi:putative transcriptional regulator